MSNHSLTTFLLDGAWHCWCDCDQQSFPCEHRWQAEDWGTAHLANIARVRAHLRSHNPSLRDQANWYRKQANKSTDPVQKRMWENLADGLEHRLGHPAVEQPLFEENA